MTGSGLDTCSIAFRPQTQEWSDLALEQPHRPGPGGSLLFTEPGPGGTKLGAFGRGLFFWEGRVDALLTGSEDSWNLRPVADLPVVEWEARQAFEQLTGEPIDFGWPVRGEVRRFDLAHEFEFAEGRHGLAFLRTLGGMTPPRRKVEVIKGQDGQPQTVYVRHLRSFAVDARAYDKGVESGSHAPGERVRYEAQRRPARAKRYEAATMAELDLRGEFGRSINPYLEGGPVIAAGSKATVVKLAQAAAAGELSIARAERMIGSVEVLREYGRAIYGDERKAQRRLKDLRDAGVALDDELPAEAVVPVGELLRDAVERFSV
jgi:hypothetical protein